MMPDIKSIQGVLSGVLGPIHCSTEFGIQVLLPQRSPEFAVHLACLHVPSEGGVQLRCDGQTNLNLRGLSICMVVGHVHNAVDLVVMFSGVAVVGEHA